MRLLEKPAIQLLLVTLLGIIIYSDTFQVPFYFDDETSIVNNPGVKELGTFFSGAGYDFNPRRFVGYLTFALNYHFGGLNVAGYHVFNLAVHIASACLVYVLVRLTLGTPFFKNAECGTRSAELITQNSKLKTQNSNSSLILHPSSFIALFAALLFVCHPVQTQAITYIVQRLSSLATMFYLASLVLYVKARLGIEARGTGREASGQKNRREGETTGGGTWLVPVLLYAGSLLSAVLAMKTKEIAVTLPVLVLLYEIFFFRGRVGRRLLFLLPMLLTLAVIPLSMVEGEKPAGELLADLNDKARDVTPLSRGDYLVTQFRVIVTYLRLLVLPVNQNMDYDYPVYHSLFTPAVFLSFLFLLALFCLAIYLFYRSTRLRAVALQRAGAFNVRCSTFEVQNSKLETRNSKPAILRLIAFGILWFFVTLSVESSIVPIADVIFEHRLYLPSVGAFIAFSAFVFLVWLKLKNAGSALEKAFIPMLTVTVLVLAGAAYARNSVWKDGVEFWRDVAVKSPAKARPHTNLGLFYKKRGEYGKAIMEYNAAVKLAPVGALPDFNLSNLHYNMGNLHDESGNLPEAVREYRIAITMHPDNHDAHYNLGNVYFRQKRYDEAKEEFQTVIKLKPDDPEAYNNLGTVLYTQGLYAEAIGKFQAAIKLDPNNVAAGKNLANAKKVLAGSQK